MSRFAEFPNGSLLMVNVDRIAAVFVNDDFDEDHEPTVDVFFSNHPDERPLRLPWADWEVVRAKMAPNPPTHNTQHRKGH